MFKRAGSNPLLPNPVVPIAISIHVDDFSDNVEQVFLDSRFRGPAARAVDQFFFRFRVVNTTVLEAANGARVPKSFEQIAVFESSIRLAGSFNRYCFRFAGRTGSRPALGTFEVSSNVIGRDLRGRATNRARVHDDLFYEHEEKAKLLKTTAPSIKSPNRSFKISVVLD